MAVALSLREIRNLDYAVLLCDRLEATRDFYRDVLQFPVETDRGDWVSFRVGARS
jgi:catechol 2,3-dioxygenase-like lactoylglutathione lyase family enzyme